MYLTGNQQYYDAERSWNAVVSVVGGFAVVSVVGGFLLWSGIEEEEEEFKPIESRPLNP